MRVPRPGVLAVVVLAAGCGGDPFSAQDALGVWDLRQFNATAVTGDTPKGVTVRTGGDSTVTVLQAFSLTFSSGSRCSWIFDDGLSDPQTQNDCEYSVSPDGIVTLDLIGLFGAVRSVSGTAVEGVLTLTDQDTNVLELRKRS